MTKAAVAEVEALPEKLKRPLKALPRDNLKLMESTNHFWRMVAPRGTTREDLISSDLHSVVADVYLPNDIVFVVAEDRSYFATLLIVDAGRGYAHAVELQYTKLPPVLTTCDGLPPGFEIEWAGPDNQYQIIRLSDSVCMRTGFQNRQDALIWLTDHASLR